MKIALRKKLIYLLLVLTTALLCFLLLLFPRPAQLADLAQAADYNATLPDIKILPPPQESENNPPSRVHAVTAAVAQAKLAIVIDDVGYNLSELEGFLKLSIPLTFAVLPHLSHSSEAATIIHSAGQEVILHMPMEPLGTADPGEGALMTGMSQEEVNELLDRALNSVPFARGINNHMGSKATADQKLMQYLMAYLRAKSLFFLDSKTTAGSLAFDLAHQEKIPALYRNVFLDNEPQLEKISGQFTQGEEMARNSGFVIMIGHIQNNDTVLFLRDLRIDRKYFQLVFLKDLY